MNFQIPLSSVSKLVHCESGILAICDLLLMTFRDHYEEIVQFPIDIGDDIGGVYDWNIGTTPQTQLDGQPRRLPMGRVVGGGSILNGMVWNVWIHSHQFKMLFSVY